MAHRLFEDAKIRKVTPGILSKYVNDDYDTKSMLSRPSIIGTQKQSLASTCEVKLKLYINNIRLCKSCRKYLKHKFGENIDVFLKLKWKFHNVQECISSPEKVTHQRVKFDFQGKYIFDSDEAFFTAVQTKPIAFELFGVSGNQEIIIGRNDLYFENFLETASQKHEAKVYFSNQVIDSAVTSVAILLIFYQFTSTELNFSSFTANLRGKSFMMQSTFHSSIKQLKINFDRVYVSTKEIENFQDSLQLVLNRNKALKTTQSEISSELKDRVRWLQTEANWKMTLQEHAILHGKNPADVKWRQWRDDETANVKLRDYSKKPEIYKPEFSIKFKSLTFFKHSTIMRDDDIKQIFIYYSFLRHEGPEMETEFTYLKPSEEKEVKICFKKTFPIDLKKDYEHCGVLANMIKNYEKIRFVVVSEPVENIENPIQTCEEIGYAEACVSDLMELDGNEGTVAYEVVNTRNLTEVVGTLQVKFRGAMAARRMALMHLVPRDFKLLIYK